MGFFQNARGFTMNSPTFNDVAGDQNVHNQNHYDNRRNCGNTTTHTIQGSYNDYSITDNSHGHTFQTNNGSGAFFAGPQRDYFAAPHRQAQRARGRVQPNQSSTRGRAPAPQYGGHRPERAAYVNASFDDASQSHPADPHDGYTGQDPWGDQTPMTIQYHNENNAAWPPQLRYPSTNPFANHFPARTQSDPPAPAPPMGSDYSHRPRYRHQTTEPAPSDVRYADWQQQQNWHWDTPAAGAGAGVRESGSGTMGLPSDGGQARNGGGRGRAREEVVWEDEEMDEDEDEVDGRNGHPNGTAVHGW
ncbi:hypothetical protein HGRIS_013988 [Hohenbuehelia grisea]|uniref:Uncharacterized protein n=1 Tax=Hohenbuehelia grisea TaxID=104357 RepID=A0ABR3JS57_9AGAR